MTTATVTSKGQIVIPAAIRRHLNIKKGVRFSIFERGNQIVLQPLTREYFGSMAGMVKAKKSMTALLAEEKAKDKRREAAR